jgi:hypothetical protein
MTAVIKSITPSFGPTTGGTDILIECLNCYSPVTVTIDSVDCLNIQVFSDSIQCTTGIRLNPPPNGSSFIVTSQGSQVVLLTDPFLYIDRWSSQNTWGGEAVPRDGDSVYVPKGMNLLID